MKYKVKRKDSMQLNESITNTAYIFFDYNSPVSTNTVSATLALNVGMNSVVENGILIYPNPAVNQLTITSRQNSIDEIEITDMVGQIVSSQYFVRQTETILDIRSLNPGLYFLKIKSEKGSVTKRFVKQ